MRDAALTLFEQGGLLTRPPKEFGETSRGKQKISQAQQCDTDVSVALLEQRIKSQYLTTEDS